MLWCPLRYAILVILSLVCSTFTHLLRAACHEMQSDTLGGEACGIAGDEPMQVAHTLLQEEHLTR